MWGRADVSVGSLPPAGGVSCGGAGIARADGGFEFAGRTFSGADGAGDARKRLTIEAEAKLHEHRWPGNVRELMHVLERGAILLETGWR